MRPAFSAILLNSGSVQARTVSTFANAPLAAAALALELSGSPLRFDDNPFSGGRETHVAPPTLGQHSGEIRAWLEESPDGAGT